MEVVLRASMARRCLIHKELADGASKPSYSQVHKIQQISLFRQTVRPRGGATSHFMTNLNLTIPAVTKPDLTNWLTARLTQSPIVSRAVIRAPGIVSPSSHSHSAEPPTEYVGVISDRLAGRDCDGMTDLSRGRSFSTFPLTDDQVIYMQRTI